MRHQMNRKYAHTKKTNITENKKFREQTTRQFSGYHILHAARVKCCLAKGYLKIYFHQGDYERRFL